MSRVLSITLLAILAVCVAIAGFAVPGLGLLFIVGALLLLAAGALMFADPSRHGDHVPDESETRRKAL